MVSDSSLWSWWLEVTITLLAITLAILWYQSGKSSKLPPGPRGLPVVGYLPFMEPNLLHEFSTMAQRYGPIFKLQLGSKTLVIISSPELARVVLRDQDEIFANRDPPMASIITSYGLKSIAWSDNNSHWRKLRRVFTQEILSSKNMEASSTFRQIEVKKAIRHLYEKMGTEVDIAGMAFLTSLGVITNILWGNSLQVDDEKSTNLGIEFREVILELARVLTKENVSDFFPVLSRFDLQGVDRETKVVWKKIDGIFDRIIEKRISTNAKDGVEQEGRKDFLQVLLDLKEKNGTTSLDLTEIKALFLDVVLGGTDTTATTVEWVMAELLKNPKEMRKVQDELKQVLGENMINIEEYQYHLSELHYLDAVIKETFRLHPLFPLLIPRSPKQSCKVGGYTVPKGANVYINLPAMHMDPQFWDNPTEFNPNRFLNVDGTTKFDYNGQNTIYMPFGAGRRKCPGIPIADKTFVYLLASMLHSFDWTLPLGKKLELSAKLQGPLKKKEKLIAIPSRRI